NDGSPDVRRSNFVELIRLGSSAVEFRCMARLPLMKAGVWSASDSFGCRPSLTMLCHQLKTSTAGPWLKVAVRLSSDRTVPPLLLIRDCTIQSPLWAVGSVNGALPVLSLICWLYCRTWSQVSGGLSGSSPAALKMSAL